MSRFFVTLINLLKLPFFLVLYLVYAAVYTILVFVGLWLNISWVSWFVRQELPTDEAWFQPQSSTSAIPPETNKQEYRTTLDLALTSDHHELVIQLTVHGSSVGWIKFDKEGSQRVIAALTRLSNQIVERPPCQVIDLFPGQQDR